MKLRPHSPETQRRWIEVGLIVGFWVFIFVLTAGQRAIDPRGGSGLSWWDVLDDGLEYGLWLVLTPAIFWLSSRFTLERNARHLLIHLLLVLIVPIVVDTFGYLTYHFWGPGVRRSGLNLTGRILRLRFLDEFIIYLIVLAAGFARDYFLRYRERHEEAAELRTQAVELQAQLTESRLQALRMQINPHFLFNTLHAISTLVERDPRGVRRMIARLSDLLRYTLESTSAQEVPLHQELRFLEGYLDIQRVRFQGRIEIEVAAPPDVMEALVPNLVLQPLVENAIQHGLAQVEGIGRLQVEARRERNRLVLTVRDNGPGLAGGGEDFREGLGLRNTRERLERLYGNAQRLTLEPAEPNGLIATVELPFHTPSDFLGR